jgi:hypothetical protein
MRLVKDFLQDETGVILSAEAVMIGTLGVLGTVVGLNAASTAVDQELKEFAGAIRSLDQSYGYIGHQSCRAWTAGSYYRQPPVQQALNDLCAEGTVDIQTIQNYVDGQRKSYLPAAPRSASDPVPALPSAPATSAKPNQILLPTPERGAEPGAK